MRQQNATSVERRGGITFVDLRLNLLKSGVLGLVSC